LPRVNVLLLNWNGWRDTVECLETVFRLDYPNFRVIVCDNASSDGSVEHILDWAAGRLTADVPAGELRHLAPDPVAKPIRVTELDRQRAERAGADPARDAELIVIRTGANLGFAGGNNVGLRYLTGVAKHDLVWLLNNDMVVAPDSLRLMVDRLLGGNRVGLVGATLLEYARPEIIDSAGGGRLVPWQGMPRETSATGQKRGTPAAIPSRLDFISCGCLLTHVATVADIGLIDERYFMYCEDIDYSLRARARGLSIVHCVPAEIWHKGGSSVVHRSPRHDYYLVRSALLLVQKFHPHLLPAAMGFSLYRCLLPKVIRFQGARLRAVARGYRDFATTTFLRRSTAADTPIGAPAE
jgi:hypothetical protein